MNNVNKTLYIPLYGKAYVSQKGIILKDKKAEDIWEKEGFELKRKSKSKYLAYFMAMRSCVFDNWLKEEIQKSNDSVVLHIGCGLDSRCMRVPCDHLWYDIDFDSVIKERTCYFEETDSYHMIGADVRTCDWIDLIEKKEHAIVVMEGVSMYMSNDELKGLFCLLNHHFKKVSVLMDCYSVFGAKMSQYKNPINEVGVRDVYGLDEPESLDITGIKYIRSYLLTPDNLIDELEGVEKIIFKKLYAGNIAKKIYKLYELRSE